MTPTHLQDAELLRGILAQVGAEFSRHGEACRVVKTGFGPAESQPGVSPSQLAGRGLCPPAEEPGGISPAASLFRTQPGIEPGSVWHF